jgi:hypothetical protein
MVVFSGPSDAPASAALRQIRAVLLGAVEASVAAATAARDPL